MFSELNLWLLLIFDTLHAAFSINVNMQMEIRNLKPPPTILLKGILSLNYKYDGWSDGIPNSLFVICNY